MKIDCVTRRGITMAQLEDLLEEAAVLAQRGSTTPRLEELNLYHLCEDLVKPETEPYKCSWVELVAKGPQPPSVFVSHWWGSPFKETVGLLKYHAIQRNMGETDAWWICTFANNQHELDTINKPLKETPFAAAIGCCKGVVAVLDKDATIFKRIWCILEFDEGLKTKESKPDFFYDLAMCLHVKGKGNGEPLVQLDQGGSWEERTKHPLGRMTEGVGLVGVHIDVASAEATQEKDRNRILRFIIDREAAEEIVTVPPPKHRHYDELNLRLRRRFATAAAVDLARLVPFEFSDAQKRDFGASPRAVLQRLLGDFEDEVVRRLDTRGGLAVATACAKNNVKVATALLQARADVNHVKERHGETTDCPTALHKAAKTGAADTLRLMLKAKVDLEMQNQLQQTAVFVATYSKEASSVTTLQLLLEARANLNCRDMFKVTPVSAALHRGSPEKLQMLLEAGGSPHCKVRGMSALAWAEKHCSEECAALLRQALGDSGEASVREWRRSPASSSSPKSQWPSRGASSAGWEEAAAERPKLQRHRTSLQPQAKRWVPKLERGSTDPQK